ncbi:MAG: hypothetical protein V2I57_01125 [Xanthomonadales bacterium]|jgi:hypothetical protein|nr:hypothetical protein [Xanthomonadales bacterium]
MAGDRDQKGGGPGDDKALKAESPAARRRRIEKMREKRELRALLDDFGDGEFDLDLDLELEDDEDDEDGSRYVAAQDEDDVDLDDADLSDDDDYVDDDFDDEDED